ncbi:hypothetical protein [Herbidospora cretacea]|uniref:hypothetical protein n=1 Tax=Herbidospora cretacea TaxID=28444 RepID=UPI0007743CF6|nr:hypothetical protein [Herbidospora cretacea]
MSDIVVLDTETNSLRPDRVPWDVAMVTVDATGTVKEYAAFVEMTHWDKANADPMALQVGGYFSRYPDFVPGGYVGRASGVARDVERWTRGKTIVGAVPNFDTECLAAMMRREGVVPSWHYHLLDIEILVAGYLIAKGEKLKLPWKSDELSKAIGVDPGDYDRHTALGDCRWTLAQLQVVAPHLLAPTPATQDGLSLAA